MKEQEIIPGTPVRYWSVIMSDGYKEGSVDTTITSTPWKLGGHTWVCSVADVKGCVSIDHLEKL